MANSKLKKAHLEIKVRDKIIGGLLQIISEKKIIIPDYLLTAINLLYYKQIKKGNENERKQYNDNTGDASGATTGTEAEAEERKKEIH